MRKFDTKVQDLKYQVLREVARYSWTDQLLEKEMDIPKTICAWPYSNYALLRI